MSIDIAWAAELERKGLIEPVAQTSAMLPKPISGTSKRPTFVTTAPRRLLIRLTAPIRTVNESNTGGTLGAKLARKAAAKAVMALVLPRWAEVPPGPWVVTLTRYGAKRMDSDDNLRVAMKVIKDCIAAWLGIDDGDTARVKWRYRQRAGFVACVGIEIRET